MNNLPKNREEFKEYCLRKLGKPLIQINVSEEQLQDRINESLEHFYEEHFDATQRKYLAVYITDSDVANGYIEVSKNIIEVTDVLKGRNNAVGDRGIFNPEYQYFMSELWGQQSVFSRGITNYYINMSYLNMINQFFTPSRTFQFSKKTGRVYIQDLKGAQAKEQILLLEVWGKIQGEDEDNDDSNTEIFENVWGDRWLTRYATALIKLQWGDNLSKFSGVQILGGVTLNGKEIKDEAKEEIKELEEELEMKYSLPIDFLVG